MVQCTVPAGVVRAAVLWVLVVEGLGGWGAPIHFLTILQASLFSGFSSNKNILSRVRIVGEQELTFPSRKDDIVDPGNRSEQAPDPESRQAI